MNFRHTSGPWEIVRGHKTDRPRGIVTKNKPFLNIINFNGISRAASSEAEYNARIIEKAPLMLDELVKVLRIAQKTDKSLDPIYYAKLISNITGIPFEEIW